MNADDELPAGIEQDRATLATANMILAAMELCVAKYPKRLAGLLAPMLDRLVMETERAAGLLAITEDRLSANGQRIEEQERQIQRHTDAIEKLEIALAKARQNWGRLVAAGGNQSNRGALTGRALTAPVGQTA